MDIHKLACHTGLGEKYIHAKEADMYIKKDGSMAFYMDASNPNTNLKHFKKCDVIYSEIAWRHGMTKFNRRTKIDVAWDDYMNGVGYIIKTLKKPTFIIAGKQASKYFPSAQSATPITINGGDALVYVFNSERLVREKSSEELIVSLSKEYNMVGDFSCGYGRVGLAFTNNGRRFIMSDYNRECIGYIKEYYSENI